MSKILFLLKKDNSYGYNACTSKSGLLNSTLLLAEALKSKLHYDVHIEICVDGNEIDKFVHKYRPDYCILNALWVTPVKIKELSRLWPGVDFIIRIHSRIPFLSMEGVAVGWIKEFVNTADNVFVAFNNKETRNDFVAIDIPCLYLPNIYPIEKPKELPKERMLKKIIGTLLKPKKHKSHVLNVGCFGAIRPLKNQLLQAVAAMAYCNKHSLELQFYVNSGRIEQNGDPAFKNIRALFKDSPHRLIEIGWQTHEDFKKIIGGMDIGMQVSFSESFNIVTADFVDMGIPMVVSKDIDWVSKSCVADHSEIKSIIDRMEYVLENQEQVAYENKVALYNHNQMALMWYHVVGNFSN